ncbi:NAD(P)H:quinone oxidoreductase [Pseudonocardia sp. NPDC046786]|uniref:NAD(P)H:quinone oxidoreductase n=1 Tax=Pseudonocardia sp. NPDC046786 TaxID=3155471 RepID=UPI0033FF277A
MGAQIAVFYYSSTGNVFRLAEAAADGAAEAGGTVRLRRVTELAPDSVIDRVPAWRSHLDETAHIPEASLDDLAWADGFLFGTPTRFGGAASQLRQFIDSTSGLWSAGLLADKPASAFTCAGSPHGGQEGTLLTLYQSLMHWGAFIVPLGYTDPAVDAAGGNPYGVSALDDGSGTPTDEVLAAARYQGRRLAEVTATFARGRSIAVAP